MPVYEFSSFRVDTDARELTRQGVALPLPPRVHDLLVHLLANRQRVVSKQELLGEVWRHADVSEAVIHRAVVALRDALGESGRSASMIRTVHRVGYRFVAVVHEAGRPDAPPGQPTRSSTSAPPPPPPRIGAAPASEPPRVALQSFRNATSDTAHDWACWGLPRLVCQHLADRPDLRVVNLDEVARLLDALPSRTAGPATLAGLLGARWTVDGQIEAAENDQGLRLAYTVHGGPAGVQHLFAPDISGLAERLGQALQALACAPEGWAVQASDADPFASQALALAQAHIARTDWEAAANLLKVVLDLDPRNTAARLLWLTVLPQLRDEVVFREGERLLVEARRLGDVRLQAAVHEILGRASFNRSEPGWSATGRRQLEEALRLARPWMHEDWVLRIHLNLGYVLQLQCDHISARRHYEAALRRLGLVRGRASGPHAARPRGSAGRPLRPAPPDGSQLAAFDRPAAGHRRPAAALGQHADSRRVCHGGPVTPGRHGQQ